MHRADDIRGNASLDFLALAIASIERASERFGFSKISREQKVQRFLGIFQSARGVEARRKLKANFVAANFAAHLRDIFESDYPGSLRWFKYSRPTFVKIRFSPMKGTRSAIVPKRNEVKERTKIEIGGVRPTRLRVRV